MANKDEKAKSRLLAGREQYCQFMPEAAEVEIVRRGLLPLVGQELLAIDSDQRLQLPKDIASQLAGRQLLAVERRGKLLAFNFGPDYFLTSHLRMTGQWRVLDGTELNAHPDRAQQSAYSAIPGWRATLLFSTSTALFADRRGFATMTLRSAATWAEKLGPELLSLPDSWLLPESDRQRRRAVKATLLDQALVAGIGNYLADETLWENGIHPATPGQLLSAEQWQLLYQDARDLARQALRCGGTTFRDFNSVTGQRGAGQALLMVYGQAGKPCLNCQQKLQKTKVAGRGSTYCPRCQPQEAKG